MATMAELKAQAAIDARSAWLIDIAKTILEHAEPGFHAAPRSHNDINVLWPCPRKAGA
ncbi:hypothetical protein NKDENANG_01130 [Candidatus Entotheonellaceae bacterium PAL068K]